MSNRSSNLFFGAAVMAVLAWSVAGLPVPARVLEPREMTIVEDGTIYFRQWLKPEPAWSMRPDGSGKVPLPAGVSGEPSRYLHGGHRWFLLVRQVEGKVTERRPPCRELLATCDDGRSVRLALPATLDPAVSTPRWPLHGRDGLVTWIARRRGDDGAAVEGGLYMARIIFDSKGDLVGLAEQPSAPLVTRPIFAGVLSSNWEGATGVPDIESHDWSPDGKSIVFDTAAGELGVVDLATGVVRHLTGVSGYGPVWSPDGEWIAFLVGTNLGGIGILHPDGAEFQTILQPGTDKPFVVASPTWSALGEHLAFQRVGGVPNPGSSPCPMDVIVSDRAGVGRHNLTLDMASGMIPVAWRSREEAPSLFASVHAVSP